MGLLVVPSLSFTAHGQSTNLASEIQSEMERVHTLFKEKKITEVMQILQKRAASPDFGSLSQDIQADYYYNLACGASRLGRPRDAIAYLGVAVGYESGKGEKTYVELDSVIIPLKKAQRGISYTHDPAVFWARP